MTFSTIPLIGLRADHFRHPLDLQATNTLKQFPGLDLLVRQLLGGVGEQFFYLENIASSILVSDQQLPHLHQLLLEACKILDLETPSTVYSPKSCSQCLYLCHAGKTALYCDSYLAD